MTLRILLVSLPLLVAACGAPLDPTDAEEQALTGRVYQGFTYPYVGADGKPRIVSLSAGTMACPDGTSSTSCVVDVIVTDSLGIDTPSRVAALQAGLKSTHPSFGGATVLLKGSFLSLISLQPGHPITRTFQVSNAWLAQSTQLHSTQAYYLFKNTQGQQGGFYVANLSGLQIGFTATVDWSALRLTPGIVDNQVVTGSSVASGGWGSQVAITADQAFTPFGVTLASKTF